MLDYIFDLLLPAEQYRSVRFLLHFYGAYFKAFSYWINQSLTGFNLLKGDGHFHYQSPG